jgi:hypothetical protein
MVGSVMASGLAAVTLHPTSDAVNTLVGNIKANLGSVQVVLGENGADIEDGYNAARIVAALADARLTPQSDVTLSGVDGLGITNKKAVVSTSGGSGVQVTPSQFDVEYPAAGAVAGGLAQQNYRTLVRAAGRALITPVSLSDVLTEDSVEAYIANRRVEYIFREQIVLEATNFVTYSESQTPTGHGLYYWAPYTQPNGIKYQLDFRVSGIGLPTNATYQKIPLITMLGTEYAIDTVDFSLATPKFTLYAGEEVTLSSGQSYTTDTGFTVTLSSVGLTSANVVVANFQVTNPDGDVQTFSLQQLQGIDFFTNQISVYVETACTACYIEENVATGQVTARVGTGKRYVQAGAPFPLDDRWRVEALSYALDNTAAPQLNNLAYLNLSYGTQTGADPVLAGNFQGNELTGLKEGVVIDGPHNEEGVALWQLELSGFGGATKVDSTRLTVGAVGDDATASDVLHLTWTDVGGHLNEFKPLTKGHVATIAELGGAAAGNVQFSSGTAPGPWFFINNYSVYFAGVAQDPTASRYAAQFYFGGHPNGQLVTTTYNTTVPTTVVAAGVVTGANVTLEYVDISGTTRCRVNITSMSAGRIFQGATGSTWNTLPLYCDVWPDAIQFGSIPVMDLSVPVAGILGPWFNATNITDGTIADAAGSNLNRPLLMIHEVANYNGQAGTSLQGMGVVFDSSTTNDYTSSTSAIGAQPTGLIVFNTTYTNGTYWGTLIDFNYSAPNATYINTAVPSPAAEGNLHGMTPIGTRIDVVGAEGSREVTFEVPEARRNSIVTVAEIIHESEDVEGATQTLGVGGTVDGVTIEDITADVTGTSNLACGGVAGATYYTKGAMNSNLVVVGKNAATAMYKIVVGGPWVSSLAADIDTGGLTTEAGAQYLIASGNNLLSAGLTASDTTAATNQLINLLTA